MYISYIYRYWGWRGASSWSSRTRPTR